MKKIILSILVAGGVLGPLAVSAAESSQPAGGGAPATVLADSGVKPYPLDTCLVSGEKLGEMGKPFTFVHQGQEIKLCCKGCKKDFDKNPEKFLKKLAADKK